MKARIVGDRYSGFEVQLKLPWWPFWFQAHNGRSGINTFVTMKGAEEFACKRLRDRKFIKEVTLADCPICQTEPEKGILS